MLDRFSKTLVKTMQMSLPLSLGMFQDLNGIIDFAKFITSSCQIVATWSVIIIIMKSCNIQMLFI